MVTTRQKFTRQKSGQVLHRAARPSCRHSHLAALALALACVANAAHAQEFTGREPPDSAGNRAQPAYDPPGLLLGDVRVHPTLGITGTYDSNVFARDSGVEADGYVTVVPSLAVEWSRPEQQVSLRGEMRVRRYFEFTRQDDEQYRIEASGSTEPTDRTAISGGAGWSRTTAARGTVENGLQVGDPLRQERLWADTSIQQRFNRLSLAGRISGERFRFDDVALDNGATIDQSFRDGRRLGARLTMGYDVGPRLSLLVQGNVDRFDYRLADTLDRDATGYSLVGGVRYELTRILIAELALGTRIYDFDDPTLADFKGLAPTARVRWYPNPLLSLRFDLSHSTSTSAYNSVGAVVITSGRLGTDYELRRNLVLSAEAGASFEDYGPVTGTSTLWTVLGRAAWKANRTFRLTGTVSYDHRSSSALSTVPEFKTLRVMITASIAG